MKSTELRQKYLSFFRKKGHKIIPSASLVPPQKDIATAVDQAEDVLREAPAQIEKLQKRGRGFFFSKKSSPES